MGFLTRRKNKKFEYQPRYYKEEGNPYQIEHKFDQYRSTVGKDKSLKGKFKTAFGELKNSKGGVNKTILLIIAVLVLYFLYIIDFDLSIFKGS
jgi:hypothetical protein